MDFEDDEFIKREQLDGLLFEAYEEPIKELTLLLQINEYNDIYIKCSTDSVGIFVLYIL